MFKIKVTNIKSLKTDKLFNVTMKFGIEVYYNGENNIAIKQYGKDFNCGLRYMVYEKILNQESEIKYLFQKMSF